MENTLLAKALQWIKLFPDLVQQANARQQGAALGDMEFSQAVAQYMDPEDRHLIDPSVAKFMGAPHKMNLSGMNTIGVTGETRQKTPPWLHPQGKDEYVFPPGGIYALHAEDANPALWAHEYRHESPNVRLRHPSSEAYNRYEDLYHAKTERDREEALRSLADSLYRQSLTPENRNDRIDRAYWNRWAKVLEPSILKQMEAHHRAGK
jgi:hypothetical protein